MKFPDRLRTNFELMKQVPSNKPFDVFLVKDRTKDLRPCVLRLLPASLSGDKAIVDAFMAYFSKFSEIINRAYIPTVYSVSGQVGGNVYVLEEHVSGIDLPTFIQKNRSDTDFNREIISVVGKVCEALHHAHQKDIFHLAITPEDILIDETTGRVKLVGFGVQVFAQANKIGLMSDHARKTIALEILLGSSFRPSADVYCLAKAINDICPEVFADSFVLSKALVNNPDDRYQQARDFEGALNNVLEKISKPARSRNIDTPLESKGGLKPVLTEKPVTVERDVCEPQLPQPEINKDSGPTVSSSIAKLTSWEMIAGVAAGLMVLVVGLVIYLSPIEQEQERVEKREMGGREKTHQEKGLTLEEQTRRDIESLVLKWTNVEREKREIPALKTSPLLWKLSQIHSRNQATSGVMAHASENFPKGWRTFEERMKKLKFVPPMVFGENVFWSSANLPSKATERNDYARKMVQAWMSNEKNRKNILNPTFSLIGVGFSEGYVTQLFASKEPKD